MATPHWVPGLSVSVDYYTILIRNEIGAYDATQLLAACFGGVPYLVSQQVACQLVGPRTTNTGALGPIKAINANIGQENTDGIDIDLAYSTATDKIGLPAWGTLSFNGQMNYLITDNTSAGGTTVQQAGTFSGDNGEPRFKALASLGFARDNWSVQWTSRYYGGLKNVDRSFDCPINCPAVGAGDYYGNETAGVFYHDISGSYQYKNVNLTVGVDNLFDKDPPFLFPTGQSNAAGSAGYDFTGRFIYMKASVKF